MAGMRNEQLSEIFQYELSGYPSSLFDMKYVMKAANKPALVDAVWTLIKQDTPGPSKDDCVFVMVAHYSIEFHGRRDTHMTTSVRDTWMT